VRTVRTTDFDREGGIIFGKIPAANLDENVVEAHKLRTGDFLLSRSGEYAGLTAVFSEPEDGNIYIPAAFLIRYRFDERFDPDYLLTLCCSEFGDKFVKPLATGSAQPNISGTAFSQLFVPVPPVKEQREIVRAVSQLRRAGTCISSHKGKTQVLGASLLNILTA
jgi:type I restriction enzyme S subunit